MAEEVIASLDLDVSGLIKSLQEASRSVDAFQSKTGKSLDLSPLKNQINSMVSVISGMHRQITRVLDDFASRVATVDFGKMSTSVDKFSATVTKMETVFSKADLSGVVGQIERIGKAFNTSTADVKNAIDSGKSVDLENIVPLADFREKIAAFSKEMNK